ncbi:MAG: DsbA family protein, partial [Muribaculaceae bacterium]|nr:DsbA family protein [Muribaculaceae bacterium]
ALFKAYFTGNLVRYDHKVLLDKALSVGIKEDDAKQVLESDMFDDEVRFDEREAMMRGVHGVPYIVFNGGFAVPGALTEDGFKSALRRELRKQEEEAQDTERPHACGPNGCELL